MLEEYVYTDVNKNHFRFTCFVHWEAKDDLPVDGKNFQPSQRGAGLDFQAPRWSRSWYSC